MKDFNKKLAKCFVDMDTYNEIKSFIKCSELKSISEFVKISIKLALKNKDNLLK